MVQKRPVLILPDWADWVIAFIGAVLVWRFIESVAQPSTELIIVLITLAVKVLVLVITYFLVWVIVRTLAEPSRLYAQGLKILNGSVWPDLKTIHGQFDLMQKLRVTDAAGLRHDCEMLSASLTYTEKNVIDPLLQKSGIALYNGMIDIRTNVDALAKLLPGHVLLLKNPEIVDDLDKKLAENRQGLQGYLSFIEEEARRVSAGEIFSMTTGARMLGALVNVLPRSGGKS